MKPRTLALIAVIGTALAIVAFKQTRPLPATSASKSGLGQNGSVLLVANLSEADEKCSCGEIIRAIRAAQKNGILAQEFNPDSKSEVLKRYRILTAPTVLFLDASGNEVSRYEGEDRGTVEAIRSHLKRMTKRSGI